MSKEEGSNGSAYLVRELPGVEHTSRGARIIIEKLESQKNDVVSICGQALKSARH